MVALDRGRPHEYRRATPDGGILEVRSAPTAEGGFVITLTDITALARAEAAARDRANLLQAMLDHMRHGIVVFGPDHRVLAANELCSTLGGMAPGTVRPGRGLPELVAERVAANGPFEPAAAAAAIAEDLGLDRRLPLRRERLNAHGRMVAVNSDPLPDGGFVISYVDTTEVSAAKAEAQHRAMLLQTMQDSMRHGIALFGPDQRLIVANRLAPDLAGLPAEEMVPGITAYDLAMRQLRHGVFGQGPDAEAEALEVAQRDRSRSHPVRRRMPDGRVVDSVSDPTPDGGFVITWSDTTAQVAAEAAAAERTATLQAMIDTMHHGVVLFGPDHRFIADNRLSRELAGVPDAAARPGASFKSITAALFSAGATGDPALDAQLAGMSLQADRSRPLHYTRPMRDGRTLEVFSDPMPDGGFVVTLSDITPLARAEAEAKRRAATQRGDAGR
ncbi:PAS-domain containing protein [Dankookia sp. P2]|uniref:PAS-domain containing protein n=1 Tax=Dankookia sp. P2 TaxID=3423955 RepID=UPI003D67760A